jgi:hypothetical protein
LSDGVEVGRKVEEAGAGRLDQLAHLRSFVAGQVVQNDDVAGLPFGRETRAMSVPNASGLIEPSRTQGATTPFCRSPATQVVVVQCPCGALARVPAVWSNPGRPGEPKANSSRFTHLGRRSNGSFAAIERPLLNAFSMTEPSGAPPRACWRRRRMSPCS